MAGESPVAEAKDAASAAPSDAPASDSAASCHSTDKELGDIVATIGLSQDAPAGSDGDVKMKRLEILGFKFAASERSAQRALVGASFLLFSVNGLMLPFLLPKLRAFLGAPYLPMRRQYVETLFDRVLPAWAASKGVSAAPTGSGAAGGGPLAGLRLVDFGSGDGRLVQAAASRGMQAVGYELNPYLVWWSRLRAWRGRLPITACAGSAEIRWANAWAADLRTADVVTVYGRPGDNLMARIAEKFEAELPPRAAVVSHVFHIPGWERLLVQDVDGLKLYDLSRRHRLPSRGTSTLRQRAAAPLVE
mmetsp:Transcript_132900/g.230935  ORF Transcript_132900/g.230935 Transcript_132900/m.230935 type:complete len:305 (+) Transcript_132900:86-1000(+)